MHRSLKPITLLPFREGKQSACPTLSVSTKRRAGLACRLGRLRGGPRRGPSPLHPLLQKGKKPMKQKKDRTFTVRFTEEQFRRIQEQADKAMMTPSNHIRAAALRKKLQVILDGESRGERAQRHREQPEPAHYPGPHGPGAGGESGRRPPGFGQASTTASLSWRNRSPR